MKKKFILLLTLTFIITVVIISCENKEHTAGDNATAKEAHTDSTSLVKRGEYLVSIMGCEDCHTPKKMGPKGPEFDLEKRLSGHRSELSLPPVDTNVVKKGWAMTNPEFTGWVGPWGASFSANITSDETGIGNWSEEQFKKALTEGKWKGMDGNRMLLPPMPWEMYKNLTDEDVRAIYLFLKSTKPVKNIEPSIRAFADLK